MIVGAEQDQTYLTETMSVSVQRISDRTPSTPRGSERASLRSRRDRLAKGVERARADVAEDDAERAEREREKAGTGCLACSAVAVLASASLPAREDEAIRLLTDAWGA